MDELLQPGATCIDATVNDRKFFGNKKPGMIAHPGLH
jgi:hypothetical protein